MSPPPIPVVKPGDKLPPFSELKAMFAYDTSEPLNTSLGVSYPKYGVTVQQVSFNGNGRSLGGYLVWPEGEGPFPVVFWAPGHGGGYDVLMWLPDAAKLAKKGYAGLLLDEPGTLVFNYDAAEEGRGIIDYVVQTSRGLDLLATLPQIDAERVGFVGWSMGTMPGTVLAGLNDRIKTFVFVSTGSADPATWAAADRADIKAHDVSVKAYAAQSSIFDPAVYFSRNREADFLFMWGEDELSPALKAWYLAGAPKHSTLRLHAPGHVVLEDAHKILLAWIQEKL
jgi:pimeloyl-ACP methyl ester carboxylesterase